MCVINAVQAMERVHRIGQTKPVRIYRLVCHASIEERMLRKAEKKLYLNAMVGEDTSGGGDNDGEGCQNEDEDGAALTIAEEARSGGITKAELASLIRYGANAIVGGGGGSENDTGTMNTKAGMLDSELYDLLERDGRKSGEKNEKSKGTSEQDNTSTSTQEGQPSEVADLDCVNARISSNLLMEVDLRQLGTMVYPDANTVASNVIDGKGDSGNGNVKKRKAKRESVAEDAILLDKRQRKNRIVMVDAAGSGYGAASIPVLSNNMAVDEEEELAIQAAKRKKEEKEKRRRAWRHLVCWL